MKFYSLLLLACVLTVFSCREKEFAAVPTPYKFVTPYGFPKPNLPADNPLTVEGIEVGRHIFYDERMSIDGSISCASCHFPQHGFSDTSAVSKGVFNRMGTRNAMPLFNLAWYNSFMWDGAGANLFNQILIPWTSHIEMGVLDVQIPEVLKRFQDDGNFVALYKKAFLTEKITMENMLKAIVQFELTMVSASSKYDLYTQGKATLTVDEQAGMDIYMKIDDGPGSGECQHCHPVGGNFSDAQFRNNGLDRFPTDIGRGKISMNPLDNYKFKVPSTRNLIYTAPYMHDGRFNTIDQVINHYADQFDTLSPNLDPNLSHLPVPHGRLSNKDKAQLKAFLLTLTDTAFMNNPKFKDPN